MDRQQAAVIECQFLAAWLRAEGFAARELSVTALGFVRSRLYAGPSQRNVICRAVVESARC
jgi:hypothetical protein